MHAQNLTLFFRLALNAKRRNLAAVNDVHVHIRCTLCKCLPKSSPSNESREVPIVDGTVKPFKSYNWCAICAFRVSQAQVAVRSAS